MKNYMEEPTYSKGGWKKQCYMDRDHQFHVKAYWIEQFRIAALKAPKITPKPFNPAGCYNGNMGWYERGFVSPTEARYPSYQEDPAAYYGD